MNDGEHTRQELKDLSPLLAGISNKMLNEIPEGYFIGLSESIISKIHQKTDRIPATDIPFSIPGGYFEDLPQNILEKIRTGNLSNSEINANDELMGIAPLLATVSKKNVYTVDENYFAKKDWNIFRQEEKASAKIITFPRWTHYLVAASVFVIIAISAVFYVGNNNLPPESGNSFAIELKKLPDSVISNYLDSTTVYSIGVNTPVNQQIDVNTLLYNISDQQIENYLDNTKDNSMPLSHDI
ncbi:MAG: hypothetical protein WAU24_14530 [Chitinophagaceae bacterium]